jgi:hypothetical protein
VVGWGLSASFGPVFRPVPPCVTPSRRFHADPSASPKPRVFQRSPHARDCRHSRSFNPPSPFSCPRPSPHLLSYTPAATLAPTGVVARRPDGALRALRRRRRSQTRRPKRCAPAARARHRARGSAGGEMGGCRVRARKSTSNPRNHCARRPAQHGCRSRARVTLLRAALGADPGPHPARCRPARPGTFSPLLVCQQCRLRMPEPPSDAASTHT